MNLSTSILYRMRPPRYDDEEQNKKAGMLLLLISATLLGLVSIFGVSAISPQFTLFVPLGFGISLMCLSCILLYMKRLEAASIIMVLTLFGIINYLMITYDGSRDSSIFAIPGMLIIAGLLLRKWMFYSFSAITLAALGAVRWLEYSGRLKTRFSSFDSPYDGIVIIIIIIITAITVHILIGKLLANLEQVTKKEKELRVQSQQLMELDQQFHAIASHTPDHILMQDSDLRYTLVINPQLGLTEAGMLGKNDIELLGEEDGQKLTSLKSQILENARPQHVEFPLKNLKGKTEYFEGDYIPRLDANGTPIGIIGYFQNATARKQAEKILLESEEKFRAIFRTGLDANYIATLDGKIIEVNDAFQDIFGYAREEVIGKTSLELNLYFEPHDRARMLSELKSKGKVKELEFNGRKKNGEIFSVSLSVSMLSMNAVPHIVGVIRDITERKQKEERLRKDEEGLRIILDATPFPIALVDAQDNLIRFWSHSALELFGHTAPTVSEWFEMAYPDMAYRQEVTERWKPFVETARVSGQTVNTGEYEVTCKNGTVLVCELYATFLADNLIVTFNDITERKNAEISFRESQALYHSFVDNLPAGVFSKDSEGRYNFINERFCQLKGLKADEILGKTPRELAAYEIAMATIRPPIAIGIQRTLALQGADNHDMIMRNGKQIELEEVYPQPDGSIQFFHVLKSPVFDSEGRVIGSQGVQFDITERRQVEENLIKNEALVRTAVENLPLIFYMIDPEGIFKLSIGAGLKGLGFKPNQVTGQSVFDVYKDYPDIMNSIRRSLSGEMVNFASHIGETSFDNFLTPISMTDGKYAGVVGVALDVTERDRTEKELQKHREHLEELVKERTQKLERLNRVFVGREIRMKELKKKITELENTTKENISHSSGGHSIAERTPDQEVDG